MEPRNTASLSWTDQRFNFIILTLDGLFFWLGISYFSPTTILPLFVSHLTESNLVIGAVPAVVAVAWSLPQLAGARAIGRQTSRKHYIVRTALLGRVPLLALVIITALFAEPHPTLTLVLFFICFGLFRLTGGLNTPAYYDLVATVISPRLRARFIGLSQFLGGAIAALGLLAGGALLDALPFPTGFVVSFSIGLFFVTVAIGFMAVVREPPFATHPVGSGETKVQGAAAILGVAGEALRQDAHFRRYLYSRVLLALAGMALAFYAIHATRVLGASDGDVAFFTAVLLASQTGSTLLWGAVADRLQLTPVLVAATILNFAATALALAAPSLVWFPGIFLLAGGSLGALAVTDPGLPLALAEAASVDRALYVALANTVLAPFHMLAPLLGGAAADAGGYGLTYALALASATAAGISIVYTSRASRIAPSDGASP
ncbi:MAG TPA: hypothetical protein VGW38_13370 [Chloroflexota bacterium]|nr:hypothetical protein [Chloroflexota bacterium]